MSEFVKHEIDAGVGRVTLSRPDLHNAFNEVVIRELHEAFVDLGGDERVRAIVLQAEGKSYCAGADLHWMKRMVGYSFEENVADAMTMANMLRAIHECPKPTIARVHGAAFGGGVGLVAACDMAVALESAVFCLSEVKLGIIPAVISSFVLHKTGPSAFRRYAITAERFGGAEAKRMGLVSETADTPETMDAVINSLTEAIKANGPQAVAACKSVIGEVLAFNWDRALDITTQRIAARRVSDEGQEGMKSFLEKRNPNWMDGGAT
jgi:methylglutaconyl-CoA hydratase